MPRPQQDFGDKGDDGPRRLLGVQLREDVTRIAPPRRPCLLRHEPENPGGAEARVRSVPPSFPGVPFWGLSTYLAVLPSGFAHLGGVTGVGLWEGLDGWGSPCVPPLSPAVLRVGATVGDAAHGVVPAEKESGGGEGTVRRGLGGERVGGRAGGGACQGV